MSAPDLVAFLATLSFGPAQMCRNLTVIPLLSPTARSSGLLTLDEALARGVAEVTEVSEQGSVPQLLFLNHGEEPILLIDGEELVGARQNRILNLTILAPGRQSLEIPVSCVEQGRWAWKSRRFASSDRTIYAKLRRANVESVSASLRREGRRNADQGQVWDSVAQKAGRLDVRSDTGAAGEMYDRHAADLDGFVNGFRIADGQVGAVFLVNGRLAGLEAFGSADLPPRLLSKVVRGYALDALDDQRPTRAAEAAFDPAAILRALAESKASRHRAIGLGEDLRLAGDELVGAGLVADGKVVHLTAYAMDYA